MICRPQLRQVLDAACRAVRVRRETKYVDGRHQQMVYPASRCASIPSAELLRVVAALKDGRHGK